MASRSSLKLPRRTDAPGGRPSPFLVDPSANPIALNAVLDQVPGLLWVVDSELFCRYVSKPPPRGFGVAVGQVVEGAPAAAHRRALAGEVVTYEVRSGAQLFSCRVGPMSDAGGKIEGVLGSAQEVATQPVATPPEAVVYGAFQSMLEHAADGIAILDAQGRFIFMNSTARRLADVEPIGTAITQGSSIWGEWVDADGKPMPAEDWPLVRALRGEVTQAQEIGKRYPDGTSHHILFSAVPVRDPGGAIIGAVATVVDITARRRSEDAIRASNDELEERVRARTAELELSRQQLLGIVNNSTAVIYLKDTSGRYLLINRQFEKIFAITNEEIAGRDDFDFLPDASARAVRANDARVVAAGEPISFEELVPLADGNHTYISIKFPLRDPNGAIYGVCGISTDISERERMEAEIRRHQAELAHVLRVHTMGQMAASLAHEINQPLAAIASYAHGSRNWLLSGSCDREHLLPALEQIAGEALRAGEITRRLRDLLRKGTPRREQAELDVIVSNALGIAEPVARRHGVSLHLEAAGEPASLRVDGIQIEQVLLNLLLNGIDAAGAVPGDRRVDVRTRSDRSGVEITVSDSGAGIDRSVGERLFEPFFTTKPNGLGMGLAISRSIVEAHGGRIWLEAGSGPGACFRFVLPAGAGERK